MTYIRRSLRLYLANRSWALYTPLYILGIMTMFSVIIAAIIGISVGYPLPDDIVQNMRYNGGALYAPPGFLFSVGVLAMNRNFSMALAFGSTRRDLWLGTSIGFLITSTLVGLGSLVFLALERATDHWFIGARAFDVQFLAEGDLVRTFTTMFLLAILSLYAGAFFGTVFRAFGTVWTAVSAILVTLALLGVIALAVWQSSLTSELWDSLGAWLLLNIAAVLALLAAAGSYAVNRRAVV